MILFPAIDLYEKGLNEGYDHDTVINLIKQAYDDWYSYKTSLSQYTYSDLVDHYMQERERFPETRDVAYARVERIISVFLNQYNEKGIDQLISACRALTTNFADNEELSSRLKELSKEKIKEEIKHQGRTFQFVRP